METKAEYTATETPCDGRAWKCDICGFTLGYVGVDGSGAAFLRLASGVRLYDGAIPCDECGATRKFFPSSKHLVNLIERSRELRKSIARFMPEMQEFIEREVERAKQTEDVV